MPAQAMADSSPTEAEAPDWKAVAKAYGMEIPAAELERLAPTLDALVAACRATAGADLGLVEPAGSFLPGEPQGTPSAPEPIHATGGRPQPPHASHTASRNDTSSAATRSGRIRAAR